ncbi:hypothetical protein K431DRAFT_261303 [Polychaeton citri CBS 116435]|uniref:histidine kinase n=1 Tax=Polychaeton citri CBS 116435 TaxID=1314669 RepID=A0A9P4QHF7_9PEZI|nr:hypothetical protein K431DRAFT_261303 [Polychaeton citri CBS 116435]
MPQNDSPLPLGLTEGDDYGSIDDRRQKEFYKYYDPIRALSDVEPPYVDMWDPAARAKHCARSISDKALTAFCQLAALRLQTKRALLFFFDKENAYVLAEATKSISLQDDSDHDIEDSLWLGHTVIPRGISVCEATVNVASGRPSQGSNCSMPNANLIHIINDLKDDTRYCDRPFVTDEPGARFYAGVPITTPLGISIGAFCVLDEQPRDGLSDRQVMFMREMADNVMSHLEMVRSRADYGKSARMLAGLRSFVNDASPSGLVVPTLASEEPTRSPPIPIGRPEDPNPNVTRPEIVRINSIDLADRDQSLQTSRNISKRFQRAANLIREAAQFDGVVFLDASARSFCGLVDGRRQSEDLNSQNSTDGYEGSTDTGSGDNEVEPQQCRILGASTATGRTYRSPTEKMLRSLLRRHGHGKLWTINGTGDLYSSDEPSDDPCTAESSNNTDSKTSSEIRRQETRRKNTALNDASHLQRLFPGARSIHFIGLWDVVRLKWFAAAIVWTCSPLRMLSAGGELNFVSIFCESLMAEIGRIEVQAEDKAKTDFISSVSHELRSPLHGILGSVEFLHDLPGADYKVLAQIETCCKTLVDIIDHVLDYSKINYLSSQQRANRAVNGINKASDVLGSPRSQQRLQAPSHHAKVYLNHVTEEVADTVYHSFCCREQSIPFNVQDVDFILDIQKSDSTSHVSVGAWKRVCMNLISNSLKYTNRGYVKVSLSTASPSRRFPGGNATLVVQDTGRGMSREFLENHLFRAFKQEDSFAEGLGLGLCLTGKLVKEFRGSIEVQSEKGQGTTVTVMAPLALRRTDGFDLLKAPLDSPGLPTFAPIHVRAALLQAGLKGNSLIPADKWSTEALDVLVRTLSDLGFQNLSVCKHGAELSKDLDLTFVREDDLGLLYTSDTTAEIHWRKPVVVLCRTLKSAQRLQNSALASQLHGRIECITKPWGPQRLLMAMNRCMALTARVETINLYDASLQSASTIAQAQELQSITGAQNTHQPVLQASSHITHQSTVTEELVLLPPPRAQSHPHQHQLHPPPSLEPFLSQQARSPVTSVTTTTTTQSTAVTKLSPTESSKLSLLLVDDNSINLQLLSTYSAKQGHRALTATDGAAAVLAYKTAVETSLSTSTTAATTTSSTCTVSPSGSHYNIVNDTIILVPQRPHVILLDLNMPVMDGFEAARHIRAYERDIGLVPPVKIIALTGLGSKAAKDEALASGIDLFMTKPVRLKELSKILNGLSFSPVS